MNTPDQDITAAQRQNLIDHGWTPPRKPGYQPQVPTVAYLHATSNDCVTTDPTAYANGRELVLKGDVYDHITWLEAGIDEWRAVALKAKQHRLALYNAQTALQTAIGHMQAMLDPLRTATQDQKAKQAASDWLRSIGSEPQ